MSDNLYHIIAQCRLQKHEAQRALYDMYKDTLFAICRRYIKTDDAEDVFIEAFYKIFDRISSFNGEGSFEGWMKRIMINECLQYLRKSKHIHYTQDIHDLQIAEEHEDDWVEGYNIDQIMKVIEDLSPGYRTIFNLYVFDEYKHREIAEILGISINTSKSQFLCARKKIIDTLTQSKTPSFTKST